jgi:hypothetical protein
VPTSHWFRPWLLHLSCHRDLRLQSQSSSASRRTVGATGFLILSQWSDRPERYGEPSCLDTMPSEPTCKREGDPASWANAKRVFYMKRASSTNDKQNRSAGSISSLNPFNRNPDQIGLFIAKHGMTQSRELSH